MLSTDSVSGIFSKIISVLGIPTFALYVLLVVAWWCIFKKAGHCGAWSLFPIVNLFFYVKIATGNAWKTLFFLIPVFNFIYAIILNFKLARAFGRSDAFGVGLWLLPNVFLLILGFDNSTYKLK